MKWKTPPVIKVYEALGAIGDERIELLPNAAKVYSSSRGKFYEVHYDPQQQAITANDNGSFYQGYLGYPSIAFLLAIGIVPFGRAAAEMLQGFAWKDINTQFKNDWTKTEAFIVQKVEENGGDVALLAREILQIKSALEELALNRLPSELKPPAAY